MQTKTKTQAVLSLFVALTCLSTSQALAANSSFGKIQYTNFGSDLYDPFEDGFKKQPNTPEPGALIISGPAAESLWNDMTRSKHVPAAPDLENRKPEQITLKDCESKVGQNLTCKKIPRFTPDGNGLQRDSQGRVIYDAQCFVSLLDVTQGKIK